MDALTFGRLRNFGRVDKCLLLLSIMSSAAYLATRGVQPFPCSVALKALSIAPLGVLAFRVLSTAGSSPHGVESRHTRDNLILAAALALSCLGDIFLHLDPRRYFRHALGAFLFAHLAYIVLFTRSWPRPLRARGSQMLLTALVLVYSLLVSSWLWSGLGTQAVPVIVYSCAITVMTVATILAGFSQPFVWIGAVLFVISDSLIAAGRFKTAVPLAEYLIWPTYYLGQYGIAIGFLREKSGDDSQGRRV